MSVEGGEKPVRRDVEEVEAVFHSAVAQEAQLWKGEVGGACSTELPERGGVWVPKGCGLVLMDGDRVEPYNQMMDLQPFQH